MGIFRRRLTRRFSSLGLVSDLALVGAAVAQLAQRKKGTASRAASTTELAMAGGAALRLGRRFLRRRKRRKIAA